MGVMIVENMTLAEAVAELRHPTTASRQHEAVNFAIAVLAALAGEPGAE